MNDSEFQENLEIVLDLIREQRAGLNELRTAIEGEKQRLEQFRAEVRADIGGRVEKSLETQFNGVLGLFKDEVLKLRQARNQLDWKYFGVVIGGMIAVFLACFLMLLVFVPSLDEIAERRAIMTESEKYNMDLKTCGGKTCVRVMKKQCNFGENNDYCVIDPKR